MYIKKIIIMSSYFTTINQYDQKYAIGNFKEQRSACSVFALMTAYTFMINYNTSAEDHNKVLDDAIDMYINNLSNVGSITFDKLLSYQDRYKTDSVNVTSAELVKNNIIGYQHMFSEDIKHNYAVIFLKNYNYIVVLVTYNDNNVIYSVRDCHMTIQYKFSSFELLKEHLNKTYQFDKEIDLDGYKIPEFSNIEFLVIDDKFNLTFETTLGQTTDKNTSEQPFDIEINDDDNSSIESCDSFTHNIVSPLHSDYDTNLQVAMSLQEGEEEIDADEMIKEQQHIFESLKKIQ